MDIQRSPRAVNWNPSAFGAGVFGTDTSTEQVSRRRVAAMALSRAEVLLARMNSEVEQTRQDAEWALGELAESQRRRVLRIEAAEQARRYDDLEQADEHTAHAALLEATISYLSSRPEVVVHEVAVATRASAQADVEHARFMLDSLEADLVV